jgi:hypothetical protein
MKKTIAILIILGLFLPVLSFSQENPIQPPETMLAETSSNLAPRANLPRSAEEAKEMGKKALEVGEKQLPNILQRIWQEDVLPIWQRMFNWFKIYIWDKVWPWAEEKIEERKPIIEEEFEKEKEELKEEAPEIGKSLWEKFKELLK